jgi:hypothetical protein
MDFITNSILKVEAKRQPTKNSLEVNGSFSTVIEMLEIFIIEECNFVLVT